MEKWHEKYLNVPFADNGRSFKGCDCAGLAILVYKNELGLDINEATGAYRSIGCHSREDRRRLDELISESLAEWKVVDQKDAKEFDIVRYSFSKVRCHCGIYLGDGLVLHVEQGKLATVQRWQNLYGYKLAEVVRHVSRV